jgi:hypothetical protein
MAPSLIPLHDRAIAIRVKRQLMGFMSYLMFLVPLAYAVQNGWVEFGYAGLAWFSAAAVAANLAFLVAIRSGYSRRFDDPSLVLPQVCVAGLFALAIGYSLGQARVITLMLFFTSFFFGIFSFSRRQYLLLTCAAAVGYAFMLLLKYDAAARASDAFRLELLQFMVLVIVLLWLSLLGSYMAELRARLARQKEALATALERLQELASRDELTGLHNRRHIMEILEQQRERAERHGEPFALCMLDLDHFKRINDTHGHGVGDDVLRGFSERFRAQLSRMDAVGRDTGDTGDGSIGRFGGE